MRLDLCGLETIVELFGAVGVKYGRQIFKTKQLCWLISQINSHKGHASSVLPLSAVVFGFFWIWEYTGSVPLKLILACRNWKISKSSAIRRTKVNDNYHLSNDKCWPSTLPGTQPLSSHQNMSHVSPALCFHPTNFTLNICPLNRLSQDNIQFFKPELEHFSSRTWHGMRYRKYGF